MRYLGVLGVVLALGACGGGGSASPAPPSAPAGPAPATVTVQEQQCQQAGWRSEYPVAAGLTRGVLWKAPAAGTWSRGALVVMHGGGGQHTNFCVANAELIAPQVRFTEMALAQGFAVFLLNSTDQVTDVAGLLCGKVWDDEVRPRANLDLPFIDDVLRRLIPGARPAGSRRDIHLVGHSSGGYMAVRAGTRFGDLVSAIAPVASGDPYGWTRDCTRRASDRPNVFGVGLDNETRRVISESGACAAPSHPNEQAWEGASLSPKPPVRLFHHANDGINDRSCTEKVAQQLASRGYPLAEAFRLEGGVRSADVHYWLDDYNAPLLAWLAAQVKP